MAGDAQRQVAQEAATVRLQRPRRDAREPQVEEAEINLLVLTGIIGASLWLGHKLCPPEHPRDAILWCLRHEPGMRGLELCAITGISRSMIYVHLGRLEEEGRVRREEVPSAVHRGLYGYRYYAVDET